MRRIYCTHILKQPVQIKIKGRKINVSALQMPISIQKKSETGLPKETIRIDPAKAEEVFLAQKKKLGPLSVHKDLTLHFKFEEEQGRSG